MYLFFFFFQAEDGIRDKLVTGVQTCALPISRLTAAIAPQQHAVLINQRHADALELIGAELGGSGHVVGFAVPQWGSTPAAISDLASGPLPLALVAPAPVAPVGLPLSWPPDQHAVRPVASSSATTAPQTIRPAPAGPG